MILKRQNFDDKGRLVTTWTPGVISASRNYDERWQSDVLWVYFGKESSLPSDMIVLEKDEGVYLCNDEGKTIEVLSRLQPQPR